MDKHDLTDEQKAIEGHEAIKAFFDMLGPNDIYKEILLEEFFRFILEGKNDLSLLNEPRQEESGHNNVV